MNNRIELTITRITPGVAFLIFGIGKFRNDIWAQTMRNMVLFESLPWSADLSVVLIGAIELATAGGLILGLFTRSSRWPPPFSLGRCSCCSVSIKRATSASPEQHCTWPSPAATHTCGSAGRAATKPAKTDGRRWTARAAEPDSVSRQKGGEP
ncbi:MAG: DoxX family protein [Candidatus Brocadiia bacterium]